MTAAALLAHLASLGVTLVRTRADTLACEGPVGVLTDELVDAVREAKPDLLALLPLRPPGPPEGHADRRPAIPKSRVQWDQFQCPGCGWDGPEPGVTHTAFGLRCPRCDTEVRLDVDPAQSETAHPTGDSASLSPGPAPVCDDGRRVYIRALAEGLDWPRVDPSPGHHLGPGRDAWQRFLSAPFVLDVDLDKMIIALVEAIDRGVTP